MRTVGLITEYNPFHKGHRYHIEEAKKLSGASHVVVIMSGNFVQRGIPAFLDKYSRAEIALKNGVDLVLELPVIFSTGSAEIFARGAVSILDRIGITDCICFGTESSSAGELERIAEILMEEPEEFREILQKELKKGSSFPAARKKALLSVFPEADRESIEQLINSPNNILGIEYLKALARRSSSIQPLCIHRIHAGYHEEAFDKRFFSASAIRSIQDNDLLLRTLGEIDDLYVRDFQRSYPVFTSDFNEILGSRLLSAAGSCGLTDFLDVSRDIANSICKNLYSYMGIEEFASLLKSKNVAYSRISRCLLHIMLDIRGGVVKNALAHDFPSYVKILGFNDRGKELLGRIRPDITLLTKTAGYEKRLTNPLDREIFETNLQADMLYRMVVMNKFKQVVPNEFTQKIIII